MKITQEFITSRSFRSFILSHKTSFDVTEYLKDNGIEQWQIEEYECFEPNILRPLEIFHTGKSFDWIEKITGPSKEWGSLGHNRMFFSAKEELLKGKYVTYLETDRNIEIHKLFNNSHFKIITEDHIIFNTKRQRKRK